MTIGFYSAMSAQQYFNDALYQITNTVFTAIPPIIMAVFDQSLPRYTLQNTPAAFREAKGRAFHRRTFGSWILRACLHAFPVFLIPFHTVEPGVRRDGTVNGIWFSSVSVFYASVLVPTFVLCFNFQSINLLHHVAVWVTSISSLLLFPYLMNLFLYLDSDLYMVVNRFYTEPTALLAVMCATAVPLLTELAWRHGNTMLRPTIIDLLRERIRFGGNKPYHCEFSPEEEYTWAHRKKKTTFKDLAEVARSKLNDLSKMQDKVPQEADELRSSVIKAVLRFRGVTGAQFHSAAKASHTTLDKFDINGSADSQEKQQEGDQGQGSI